MACTKEKAGAPRDAPAGSSRRTRPLLDVESGVVDDERGLEARVLRGGEEDLDGLALVRGHVEALLRVAGVLVQVRVRGERREDGAGGVPDLHLHRVIG